jgi:drug/metabolite transporter (DMT)-like permease
MNDTSRTRPARGWRLWLALAVVYLVWGSTYLAIRVMVETIPPLLGAGVRFLLAGAVLYPVLLFLAGGTGLVTVAERDVPSGLAAVLVASMPLAVVLLCRLVALGYLVVAGSLVASTAYVWLLANAPVSQATTHTHVNPVVAVLLGWLVLHERVTIATLAGAALVVGSAARMRPVRAPRPFRDGSGAQR